MSKKLNKNKRKVTKHEDHVIYSVWVLWLIGFSEAIIGSRLSLTKGQVSGIINQSDYRNRSRMALAERQSKYEELVSVRYEDGQENPMDKGLLGELPRQVLTKRGG